MLHSRTQRVEALGAEPESLGDFAGWGAAIAAGAVAGLALIAVEALGAWLALGQRPGAGLGVLMAETLAGDGVSQVAAVILASLVPIVLAAAYGALVAAASRRWSGLPAWLTGAVSALLVYLVNFSYLAAPALHWIGKVQEQVSVLSPWYSALLWR